MLTLAAFLLALGLLIAVHEYGHYRVAVACGIKVLRFSIGFGPPLLRHVSARSGTEFVLCALPLGGYVRMLDEREGPVNPKDLARAFNRQPLRARAAVVAAGPLANLALAALLYSAVQWIGLPSAQPRLSSPVPGSMAERAGLLPGDWVQRLLPSDTSQASDQAELGGEAEAGEVRSFGELRWALTQAGMARQDLTLWVGEPGGPTRALRLPLSGLQSAEPSAAMFAEIGIEGPWSEPVLGAVLPGGAAAAAGLQTGDRVLRVGEEPVRDAMQLRRLVLAAGAVGDAAQAQPWLVERAGQSLLIRLRPTPELQAGVWVGRIGAYIGSAPVATVLRLGPLDGLAHGLSQTWDVASMSLRMLGRMLTGEASLKNLTGPLTIADYAGQSANQGLVPYLLFMALISVSLGVLNLLPLPILDGGHLMYYLWEGLTGRPVEAHWMERLQRLGVMLLLAMMALALFNDLSRLLG